MMMKNKNCSDKRLNSDSADDHSEGGPGGGGRSTTHHSKQSKSNSHPSKVAAANLSPSSSTSNPSEPTPTRSSITMPSTSHAHLSYSRSRSKSSISYLESKIKNKINNNLNDLNLNLNLDNRELIQANPSNNISTSLINAFQMPQMSQVFPNINMSSLPDYLTQLPSVSMPSMPNISIPTLTMPSIPNLSMPSMPNLSMPNISMPSMPNINIPSISDIMSFSGRKQIKSWSEICLAVRDSRKRYTDVCSSLPFSFNSCYDEKKEMLRLYFLSSGNSPETTLYYCDVPLDRQPPPTISMEFNNGRTTAATRGVFQIDEEMNQDNSDVRDGNSSATNNGYIVQNSTVNSLNQFEDHFDSPKYNQDSHVPFIRNNDLEENLEDNYESGNNFNLKSSSSSLSSISISSSDSSESLLISQIDSSMFRKSITSPNSSIGNLESLDWKPLILMNKTYFTTYNNNDDNFESVSTTTPSRPLNLSHDNAKSDSPSSSNKTGSSQEEDLILQRKRILFNGIVSYDFHPTVARFVFTIKNMIYWFDDLEMTHKTNPTSTSDTSNQCQPTNSQFPFANSAEHQRPSPPPYIPHKLMTNTYVKMNATMCPHNPDLVAYVADSDLWVCDLISCKEMRITSTDYSKTAITAGRPSFVMQEEFSRFNGFWWQPDCTTGGGTSDTYAILCEFVDESMVESVSISSWDGQTEVHRFPKAGCRNAKSTLKLIHFSSSDLKTMSKANNNNVRNIRIEPLPSALETIFPEFEYLLRCGWYSHDVIWAQLLNRCQNNIVLVLISISSKFPAQIILEETHDNHWYNCHDIIYFYRDHTSTSDSTVNGENSFPIVTTDEFDLTVGSTVKFLWSSELSGYRHLYKNSVTIVNFPEKEQQQQQEEMDLDCTTTSNNEPLMNGTDNSNIHLNCINSDTIKDCPTTNLKLDYVRLKSTLVSSHQITNGNWEVSETSFWVDEKNDLIYFVGNKDSPLESHLYVVSSSQSLRVLPRRLTKEDFSHSRFFFDPDFNFCIDFQSNLTIPPFAYLHQIVMTDHTPQLANLEPMYIFLGLPEGVSLSDDSEYYDKVHSLGPTPQLFEYKLKSGELIYGFLFKPDFMEPGVKYPVLLEIYGGPEVQFVTKSFKDVRQHRRHLIASEGYIVVGFDSRGSKHRGVDFERHIYKRLGQVEIYDQVEALQWLALNTGFIDMTRVAIHGWSYGGYLSLMALAQRPDIFKCAIAGAPVTNWHLYDTGYTERYMGLPEDNEEGYRSSSVMTYIKHFPHEYNRLLIIHGLMDENVHFAHTAQFINGLIMAGKPYNLNVFPFERHSLRKMHSAEHYEATLLYYLQQNL